ncbi:MAG: 23S rRNA (adenine(2503)-C(2))-methyltransferase RlmN [Tissierellia bacterium]|nr:23S rRNA (adenine(2503)-C(2))-methyltransferase RlmN [Tissierellia bacterium]
MDRIEINSLTFEELKEFMLKLGEKSYRGEQVFTYLHRSKCIDIDELHLLPKDLRENLKVISKVRKMDIYKKYISKIDNTVKYLFLLEDMNIIETVVMEYKHGYSICISTQVGCKMGCSFCASTKEGLIRNLTPAEMVNQIYLAEKDLNINISNIVLMGSGEPLDNFENTLRFIDIISHPKGHNISLRNITLSTCGLVPRIYDLAEENLPITLSISLHSPFDDERKKIMPIGRRYSIDELIEACKFYVNKTNRRITFEYTLIENVNDRDIDVKELGKILKGLKCHINLIPLNPISEYNEDRPSRKNIERVQKELMKFNISVTIRREMGGDISASCGQLRRSVTQKNK